MFWDKMKDEKRAATMDWNTFVNLDWNSNYIGTGSTDMEMKESTYFKCINRISSDVAKVPLLLKQSTENGEVLATKHYLYNLIQNPNPFMSSIDFLKAIEAVRQHRGVSGAIINRDTRGNVNALFPVEITRFVIDNVGLAKSTMQNPILVYYRCGQDGKEYTALYKDVLVFKSFTMDGIISTAVKDNLKDTISTNQSAQSYQADLFKSGLTDKVVIQTTTDIKDKNELAKINNKFNMLWDNDTNKRLFPVPAGFNLQPLSLKLSDAQFAELRKMGQVDICTSMGLMPWQVGIMDGYNNNSLEQSNLSYLNNTLLILFESIEAELNYKLLTAQDRANGFYFSFDEQTLLRMDSKTQSEVYTSYIQNSVMTPNEVRLKLGMVKAIDGDDLLASSGTLKIKDLYQTAKDNANAKGGGQVG
ncbi:phage portal protein [Clostridium sp. 19966]|uniref:phage portal protein n=1 Tax=Clostridium sp. 19966 TaxID=2768166 RepID=UPI0028DF0290|nr:phage portal protein [Clostridium sp. 19966]MDT8718991.1 phage portal protein [Clostridium sp. 19966]